jgi:hypothetical protein
MVARRTWAVIAGTLGVVGVASAFGAAAAEPRDPVALDAVQIATTQEGSQPPAQTPSPGTTSTEAATPAVTSSPNETPSPQEAQEIDEHDDSSGHGSGPTVVSPPSPVTADSAD